VTGLIADDITVEDLKEKPPPSAPIPPLSAASVAQQAQASASAASAPDRYMAPRSVLVVLISSSKTKPQAQKKQRAWREGDSVIIGPDKDERLCPIAWYKRYSAMREGLGFSLPAGPFLLLHGLCPPAPRLLTFQRNRETLVGFHQRGPHTLRRSLRPRGGRHGCGEGTRGCPPHQAPRALEERRCLHLHSRRLLLDATSARGPRVPVATVEDCPLPLFSCLDLAHVFPLPHSPLLSSSE